MVAPEGTCEVVTTRGGARAMLDRATGEVMHPVVGPLVEAERLYVGPSRLAERLQLATRDLVLLDVGLGAGSNAAAALRASEARSDAGHALAILSFDRSLDALELARTPQHAASFGLDGPVGGAARALVERGRHETERTRWSLIQGELPETLSQARGADIVFFDPFSPAKNPELWTVHAFRALRRACRDRATVHTYSGATATRSALLLAGFAVGLGPSTGEGKRATVAATHVEDLAEPLGPRWLLRLSRSSAAFPADAPKDALGQIEALPQFRA